MKYFLLSLTLEIISIYKKYKNILKRLEKKELDKKKICFIFRQYLMILDCGNYRKLIAF